jgi:hypothetical protein
MFCLNFILVPNCFKILNVIAHNFVTPLVIAFVIL